jgi:hypothetical protein
MKKQFLFVALCYLFVMPVTAQNFQDSVKYLIETTDRNEYTGTITYEDTSTIHLKTEKIGEITLSKNDIKKTTAINPAKIISGQYWFENSQSTRYFVSPNGYGLKTGEGYYQNVWIFFHQFAYGLSDYFSLGGGGYPGFLLGSDMAPVWITPKFSIPVIKDELNLGAGAFFGTALGTDDNGFGFLFGITTFGSKDKNMSIGVGYGYTGSSWARHPTININGMLRLSARGYLITENYFFETGGSGLTMVSFGGRWVGKSVCIDYGLVLPFEFGNGRSISIPWLGLYVPF